MKYLSLLEQQLHQKEPDAFFEPKAVGLLECDWNAFIQSKKKVYFTHFKSPYLC